MRGPEIIVPSEWEAFEIAPGEIVFEFCCDCNLRHVVLYTLKKKGTKTYIVRQSARDDWGKWAARKLWKNK